jgi:hypothetical protein
MSFGAIVWTSVAALAAYRALVRPVRAVFDMGEVSSCAGGSGCNPSLRIRSTTGAPSPVYSVVSGVVSRMTETRIEVTSNVEPVIVAYTGSMIPTAGLTAGQRVSAGKVLAQAASVDVAVAQITRLADGSLSLTPLDPSAWFAMRGLHAATELSPSAAWCAGGRRLSVPQDVARCGLRLPEPPGFSLLPVSVQLT